MTTWTTEGLRTHIRERSADPEDSTDEALIWFVCMQEAQMVWDCCSTKDLARMFRDGTQAIDSLEDVQAWLNTHNQVLADDPDSEDGLPDALAEHFGWEG